MKIILHVVHANNKGADQTAHVRSLRNAFVVRFLERIITNLAACKISIYLPVSVAKHTELKICWSQTPKTDFLTTRVKFCLDNNSSVS